jgi:hypothetical protein
MQVHRSARDASKTPRRSGRARAPGPTSAMVIVLAIATLISLLTREVPQATSGIGAENAGTRVGAGFMVIHDDAGNMPPGANSAIVNGTTGRTRATNTPDADDHAAVVTRWHREYLRHRQQSLR